MPPAFKNFSISQKEKTLDELVRDQWLNMTSDGNITLGVKSFLDLRSWFRNNDVPSCHVCNEAGVKVVPIALPQSRLSFLIIGFVYSESLVDFLVLSVMGFLCLYNRIIRTSHLS